jgi:hypothetical protein
MTFHILFLRAVHSSFQCSIAWTNCWRILHILSFAFFSIFVEQYLIFSAWFWAAIISLSISPLIYPLVSQENVSFYPFRWWVELFMHYYYYYMKIFRHFWQRHYLLWGHFLDTRKCLDWLYIFNFVFMCFYCFLFFVFILSSCADSVMGLCSCWVSTLKWIELHITLLNI